MGTPVPPEIPELEDDKYYRCGCDCFQDGTAKTQCDQTYQQCIMCCTTGQHIKAWQAAGWECQSPFELCVLSGFSAQRLIFCHGPYPDRDACMAEVGPC